MATSWVLEKISDVLQPAIHSTVSTAGSYAGGAMNTVGNGINGVGQSINGAIKRYGDGVRDYGNGVMDWTKADGPRAQTAANPLGLSSGTAHGKRSVTSPSVYRASPQVKTTPSKPVTGTAKPTGTPKRAESAPAKKTSPTQRTVSNASAAKKSIAATAIPVRGSRPNTGNVTAKTQPKSVSGGVKRTVETSKPKPVPNGKGISAPARTKGPAPQTRSKSNYVAAANPLGLSG